MIATISYATNPSLAHQTQTPHAKNKNTTDFAKIKNKKKYNKCKATIVARPRRVESHTNPCICNTRRRGKIRVAYKHYSYVDPVAENKNKLGLLS